MPERPFRFQLWSPEGEAAEKLCMLAGFYYGAHRDHRQASWRIPPKRQKRENLFEALCLSTEASLLLSNEILMLSTERQTLWSEGSLMWPFPANHLSFYPWLYFNSSYPSPFWGNILWKEILTLIINFPSLYVLSAMPPYPFIQPSFPPIFHKFTQNPPSQCFELETFTLGWIHVFDGIISKTQSIKLN